MVDEYFDEDQSLIDDAIGWIIALQGFIFQLQSGYQLTSPWNLILFPLKLIEDGLTIYVAASAVKDSQDSRMLAELDGSCMCLPYEFVNATLPAWNATSLEQLSWSSCGSGLVPEVASMAFAST